MKTTISICFFLALLLATLNQNKLLIKNFIQYANYADVFFLNLIIELTENNIINKYAIKLIKNKHLFYWSIYSINSAELKILNVYIKTYLKNEFI